MQTLLATPTVPRTDRPAYRPYRVRIADVRALSPSFRRITFAGADLAVFGTDGLDQRVKLVFPLPDGSLCPIDGPDVVADGSWYDRWRQLPEQLRHPFRTYTVRAARPWAHEVDVDFVVHGGTGPAARWLDSVRVGDEVILVGPDARSIHSAVGIDWRPGPARRVLLAGDETAAPAIAAITESLPADVRAEAFVEVPLSADRDALADGVRDVTWLPRDGAAVGARLLPAVRAWADANADLLRRASPSAPTPPRPGAVLEPLTEVDVDRETLWETTDAPPDDAFYAWLAGEAGVITSLRRLLVRGHGVDRSRVAFMGYWRLGRSELP